MIKLTVTALITFCSIKEHDTVFEFIIISNVLPQFVHKVSFVLPFAFGGPELSACFW